jgi:tetratricopeptide (TPR) repeat protein
MAVREVGRRAVEEELLRRFTDRDDAIQAVTAKLDYRRYPPREAVLPVVAFHGIGGVGKTWLLRYLVETELKPRRIPHALVDLRGGRYSAADALLAELSDQLGAYGFQFPRFGLVFASYRYRTIGQDMAGPQGVLDHLGPVGKILRAAPVIKDWVGLFDAFEQACSQAANWFKERLGETWRAQLQPRNPERLVALMPETFAADVAEELWGPNVEAGKVYRPVIMLDTYEELQRAGDDFVRELADHLQDCLLILAGWDRVTWASVDARWEDSARLEQHPLGQFSPKDSDEYLRERRQVADEGLRRRIYAFTQGHPMCLALAADLVGLMLDQGEAVDEASFPRQAFDEKVTTEWLTERILVRLPDRVESDLRAASVPRRFNAEVLGALLQDPTGAERRLRELAAYSFVAVDEATGDYTLHGLVREMLLAQLRAGRQAQRYKALNRQLADYYAAEADFGAFVEQVYHRWAYEPEAAFDAFADRFYHHVTRFELGECERLLAAAREQAERHQAGLLNVLAGEAQLRYQQARWDKATQILQALWNAREHLSDGLNSLVAGTLGNVYADKGEWDCAIEYYQRALEIDKYMGDMHGVAAAWGNLGIVYRRKGEWDLALEFLQRSLEIVEQMGDIDDMAKTYNDLGIVYANKGQWDRAIEFMQRALELDEHVDNDYGMAQTYTNLGQVFANKGQWDRAIKLYQRSLEKSYRLGDVHGMARTYNSLGLVCADMGAWDQAIELYQRALQIYERLGDIHGMAQTWGNLGIVYRRKGEWDRAFELYERALQTYERLGDIHGMARTWDNLGTVYLQKGEWNQAIEFCQRSLKTKQRLGDVHGMAQTWGNIALYHEAQGDLEEALAYARRALDVFRRLGAFEAAQAEALVRRLEEGVGARDA